MKLALKILCFLCTILTFGQNIVVDSQTYSPQELIEDILIDSDCIDNVSVTNFVGGNFGGTEQSFGFFDATGTSFPFETGLVMSTGKLSNVPGPNTSLSDDNAPNWEGDNDLETVLGETNTTNATILEFDFTSEASEISFRYIFASEEYQEGNPNTCNFSDLFGFLIRPATGSSYTNIALVPGTNTPVKVTTVHPEIPGGCPAENEDYFESFNPPMSPTNFAGQTKILTAIAQVIPNETYHVKLVIADEQNFRFDSAVFLEAGSFRLATGLGPDRLVNNGNALCGDETLQLSAIQEGSPSYDWFKDGIPVLSSPSGCVDCGTYTVTEPGTYNVEVTQDNGCIYYGEIIIEYAENPVGFDSFLIACDQNQDGLTFYDLYTSENSVTNGDGSLFISDFYLNEDDAINDTNTIVGANNFENTTPFQTVYARVQNQANCFSIAEVELQISNNTVVIPTLEACDGDEVDGFADFNLNDITTAISSQIPVDATVSFYLTEMDAFSETDSVSGTFQNTIPNLQTIYVKVENDNQCYSISTADLAVLYTPLLSEDETFTYCLNSFPETITLFGGVLNDAPNNYYYEWLFNGVSTEVNTTFNDINEVGVYTVIVTDPNGCSSSRTITVLPSSDPVIEDVLISEGTQNNTVTIIASGDGEFEYAVDNPDGAFQISNTFTNVSPGFHTIFVRDINGCGISEKLISVLGFPKFFTPNGDPFHERWQIYGVNSQFNQGTNIQIFNRYGKLLTQFTNESAGWDGTLNGQPLPSDDYWFLATFLDGRTFTGHFSLRR
ncbi:T9SS type B sorting domain-containing protein [Psychroserpens sp. Hel_I_66]|uniref:T9SS type B sorting domain-containing protein n=1 Tax=Psychroserpens sp. Hel_I_66 TaxID=1250004 RepID=UPI000646DC9A|nr:choice-of-anchor L domain-containing protein [Psychroserpens sp. Hel_I_66]